MKHLLISIVGMLSIYTSNAQQVIDVHCHNIFPEFTEFLERHGAAMGYRHPSGIYGKCRYRKGYTFDVGSATVLRQH